MVTPPPQSGQAVSGHGRAFPRQFQPSADQALAARAAAATVPLAVKDISASTKELNNKSFYAAGMAVFFLFFTVQFGITSLLEERAEGTLARLIAAPIPRRPILGSKLLTSFVLGVVQHGRAGDRHQPAVRRIVGKPARRAAADRRGHARGHRDHGADRHLRQERRAGRQRQSVVAVILGLLGGTFFPVSEAPGILAKLTFIAPQAWFLRGLGDLRGGSLSVIWTPIAALLVFAVVTGLYRDDSGCGGWRRCDREAIVIGIINLRRTLRRRANIFFVFVFPMLLILVLGATFGSAATPRLGVVATRPGPLARRADPAARKTPDMRVSMVGATPRCSPRSSEAISTPGSTSRPATTRRSPRPHAALNYIARPGPLGADRPAGARCRR